MRRLWSMLSIAAHISSRTRIVPYVLLRSYKIFVVTLVIAVSVVVVVVRCVAFTWTGVHAKMLLQAMVVQTRLIVGAPLPQTHGFVFELWPGTLGVSARASLGLLGNVDRSQRSRHRQCFGMLPACGSGHCGAGLVGPNHF